MRFNWHTDSMAASFRPVFTFNYLWKSVNSEGSAKAEIHFKCREAKSWSDSSNQVFKHFMFGVRSTGRSESGLAPTHKQVLFVCGALFTFERFSAQRRRRWTWTHETQGSKKNTVTWQDSMKKLTEYDVQQLHSMVKNKTWKKTKKTFSSNI